MAVTGKFGADFEDFYSAVQQADAHLRGFESNSAAVEKRLNAVSDAFSGRKILQEATIAVKAVEEVGGATTLTATEQAKLNKLLGDALTKYAAIGKDAPDDMKALYESTKAVETPTEGLSTKMIAFGTATGTMAADAIKALGRLAIDGVGALASAFGDLVMEGAEVDDIAGNFESLSTAAGHVSSTLLGELRAGTHGTISDFELMKTANEQMAAGLNLSDQDMRTLADGAFALANATGQDATTALNQMSQAMVTGNAKSVALLTGKLDLETAERKYALALGTTRDELTADQQLEARREALLDGVAAASARVGEQTDGIGEKVAQASVKWDNFRAGLALQIAQSPVLVAGFDAVMRALEQAFGGDQEALIAAIGRGISDAAIGAADFALAAIEMSRGAVQAFGVLMVPIDAAIFGILDLVTRTAEAMASFQELAASVPGVGAAFEETAKSARAVAAGYGEMRDQAKEDMETAKGLVTGHGAVHDVLNKVEGAVVQVKSAMVAANLESKAAGTALDAHAKAAGTSADETTRAAKAAADDAADLKRQEDALKAATAEGKKMAAAMTELSSVGTSWKTTLDGLDQGIVAMAEAYVRAGAEAGAIKAVLHLTDGEYKAITESIKAQDKATENAIKKQQDWAKAQVDAAKEARGLWEDYEKIRDQQTKTATDQQIAEVERWKQALITKHEEAGTLTDDLYAAIEATAGAKLDAIRVDWSALTTSATTNLQQIADKATATYQEAATGSHNLTTEQIENFRLIAEKAQESANGYATSYTTAATTVSDAMNKSADDSIAAMGRVQTAGETQLDKITGVYQSAGARAMSGATGSFASTSLVGVPKADWQKKATEAGGTVMYDTYNNPYIYIPGVNSSSGKMMPDSTARGGDPWEMLSGRAMGGPVAAGSAYVVGERGPELFVPHTDGRIATGGGGGISIVVQVQGAVLGTADQLARLVGDALVGRLRQQGVRLPSAV